MKLNNIDNNIYGACRALFLCCALAAPAAGAAVSTSSVRTEIEALEFMSREMGQNYNKFSQDYVYTGAQRTKSLSARVPVRQDPSAAKVPVAEFTSRSPAAKTAAKVPALTAPFEGILAKAKAAMSGDTKADSGNAKAEGAEKGGESKRNVFQKIGDWFSSAFKAVTGWVSDAFKWVGEKIMGKSRGLTAEEEAEMRKIYGDSIDYSKVKIIDGNHQGLWGKILTSGGAAVTWGKRIYFPDGKYSFSEKPAWLAHEMTHEYQYQTKGWGYAFKSVWGQITKGDSFYDYELVAGKKFGQYNVEQQAELVEHYYQIQNGTRSATPEEMAIYQEIMAGQGLF